MVLEKTLESPLDWKEIGSVNPKQNQPWVFIWRNDAEAVAPVLWPPDAQNIDPDVGKDWKQEKKGMTEDEMVGWHHWLNGHEFEQTLEEGQGIQACCSPWGRKGSDMTEPVKSKFCAVLCSVAPVMSDSLRPMVCSLPGSSVSGIFQARILECVAMPSSRGNGIWSIKILHHYVAHP